MGVFGTFAGDMHNVLCSFGYILFIRVSLCPREKSHFLPYGVIIYFLLILGISVYLVVKSLPSSVSRKNTMIELDIRG